MNEEFSATTHTPSNTVKTFLLEYFQENDFGRNPVRQLLNIAKEILWEPFLKITLIIVITVGIAFVSIHFNLLSVPPSRYTWSIVGVCAWFNFVWGFLHLLYFYFKILKLNHDTNQLIWQMERRRRPSIPVTVRTLFTLLELFQFVLMLTEMTMWYYHLKIEYPLFLFFLVYFFFRLSEYLLSGLLFILVCPLHKSWMTYAPRTTKQYIIKLPPWTYYSLFFTWLLFQVLINIDPNYVPSFSHWRAIHVFLYSYLAFKLLWLTYLSVQIVNMSIIPVTYEPEEERERLIDDLQISTGWIIDSKSEVVPGLEERPSALSDLPDKSLLVCGTITERFEDVIKPLGDNVVSQEVLDLSQMLKGLKRENVHEDEAASQIDTDLRRRIVQTQDVGHV